MDVCTYGHMDICAYVGTLLTFGRVHARACRGITGREGSSPTYASALVAVVAAVAAVAAAAAALVRAHACVQSCDNFHAPSIFED
ncbi:hypothetical protein POVWA1_059380 [Plasmodium ovale wallikeri]|nr:hypothetical protein POVWA1_059380 [Plasmodium ovale wallikeri]